MCIASGRTLLSQAQSLDRVHLTLLQSRTGPAAMGKASKAGLRPKQTQ